MCSACTVTGDLLESYRGSRDDGSGGIGDGTGNLGVFVEGTAIVFDSDVKRTAVSGLTENAPRTVFNVDRKIVSTVELAIGTRTAHEIEMVSALIPSGRFDPEGCIPGIVRPRAIFQNEIREDVGDVTAIWMPFEIPTELCSKLPHLIHEDCA